MMTGRPSTRISCRGLAYESGVERRAAAGTNACRIFTLGPLCLGGGAEDGPAADEGRKLGIRMLPLGVHDLRPADDC